MSRYETTGENPEILMSFLYFYQAVQAFRNCLTPWRS